MNSYPGQLTLPLVGDSPQIQDKPSGRGVYKVESRVLKLRERLQQNGVYTLSNSDLIAIALCSGGPVRESVVNQLRALVDDNGLQELLSADFGQLRLECGLTEAKTAQLQAILELARRLTMPTPKERPKIITALDAAKLVMPEMSFLDHEEMRVLLLDTKNAVVANLRLYQGTVNSSVLRAAEIFRPAVTRNCPGIVIAHNHPSGSPEPSIEDMEVTKQLVDAGRLMDIDLVDHIIIGHNSRFVSLRERMMWE